MRTGPLAIDGLHVCDNCDVGWSAQALSAITDLFKRVEPGGIMPSGECPEYGALCYPYKEGAENRRVAQGGEATGVLPKMPENDMA